MDVSGPRQRRFTKPQDLLETITEDQPSQSSALAKDSSCKASPALNSALVKSPQCPPSPTLHGGDQSAGLEKRISLSDPGWLPKLCCCIPGLILFPMLLTLVVCALFFDRAFYWITAAFTVWTAIYTTNLSISCAIGAWQMKKDVEVDWHAKLKKLQDENPETSAVMHIVFLPNYKENQDMMLHTLKNLARSALARDCMHVVLAMEEREGEAARQKAAALIDASRHLFADIFATFHPSGLAGDIPGKSSNAQWAYRQVLQRYAAQLNKYDASQVFISCCDADNLFHPQYFSSVAYHGLSMPREQRAWTIWQPPILLMRNLFSCPCPTRLSGYATILFELAGLANQKISPHCCFSGYSFTLALASHRFVDGWDRDVIAEDHHMFCKCYFASIWEQLQGLGSSSAGLDETVVVKSAMQLSPVYLPAVSYLVETDDGWFASVHARFVQARRHSQGLAELCYIFLQHVRLIQSGKAHLMPMAAHVRILNLAGKMASVHIVSHLHSVAFTLAVLMVVPQVVRWVLSMGFYELLNVVASRGIQSLLSLQTLGGLKWALFAIFGPIPPLGMIMSATTYLVVRDTIEGRLTRDPGLLKPVAPGEPAAPDVQRCAKGPDGLGWYERLKLFFFIQNDYFSGAFIAMFATGIIPATLASWSLMFKSVNSFTYVVGSKPQESDQR